MYVHTNIYARPALVPVACLSSGLDISESSLLPHAAPTCILLIIYRSLTRQLTFGTMPRYVVTERHIDPVVGRISPVVSLDIMSVRSSAAFTVQFVCLHALNTQLCTLA